MKIAIQINASPYQHQASLSAYNFTQAAIATGHEIFRVFFYHDGINNATRFSIPPQDEVNIINKWASLRKADGTTIDLVICVAAAMRRGVLSQDIANKNNINADNLHPAFRISGLGQLIEASIESERLIVFGG